ncbi:hypothetical protein G6F70_007457 [Rhizopus microsporus]|nr:hypothetical protein G6F71_007410 [Rhizopus microsporus]KAG1196424.1 hypothetical protein G6F70_007457 [Rhizopus microsporus]KAG1208161.1 hypothetical protein G6F69_007456 [Rhizopus microsporus]KAG1229382.1 hypothetical protein G6F67_007191 [Rhizopus microsporus]KAG1261370.1 hypothetical protein G6F68_006736 [Rhizopus microsporus]
MTEIKVKIYYTLRNSNSTRFTTFTMTTHSNPADVSKIPVSLSNCLWSICSSSPDIICRDHDLSIYTANFYETNSKEKSSIIWEGHGLLSWIIEQEIQIYGKPNYADNSIIDVYIDLQPTMKWAKDDFFSALKSKSYQQIKSCTSTPLHPICKCYTADDPYPRLTPSPPQRLIEKGNEADKKQSDQLPTLPSLSSVPVFRPEPIFPSYQPKELPSLHTTGTDIRKSAFTSITERSSSSSPETVEQEQQNKRRRKTPNIYADAPLYSKQVSTTVRTYYEVEKDSQGAYILPVEIDSWTVINLGTVVYDRPAYHNQRYIYPVNYTVRKWYRSMVDPKSDTQYTCRILDNGREPKFEVTADDCPMTYSGPTPTTVWTIIVRRAFAIRNQEYGHNPVGPDFFGLRKNTIAKMIQDLPNASKCSQYVWQTFEPARFNKPGRSRRRAATDVMGGVNYNLTNGRLLNNVPTQYASRYERNQKYRQPSTSSSSSSSSPVNRSSITSSSPPPPLPHLP